MLAQVHTRPERAGRGVPLPLQDAASEFGFNGLASTSMIWRLNTHGAQRRSGADFSRSQPAKGGTEQRSLPARFGAEGELSCPRDRKPLGWRRLAWFTAALVFGLQAHSAQEAKDWRAVPLQIPTAGKTGFERIEAVAAGINFSNLLSDAQVSTNRLVEDGSGVAAGDVDGDGLCDLYFCGLDNQNALYRNQGNWQFTNVTQSAGVACPGQLSTGAVLADVDGDGDRDLLVSGLGVGVRLFLNDGKGHFREATNSGLIPRFGARTMTLADVDGDGDLDLYVANYRTTTVRDSPVSVKVKKVGGKWEVPTEHRERFAAQGGGGGGVALLELGEPDILYLNDGHGRFEPLAWTSGKFLDEMGKPLASPPRDWGLSAMFRDINGDGLPDLYVCNDYYTPDRVWINQGQGVFKLLPAPALRKTCYAAMAVDFADINRDGHDEIFVTEMLSRDHLRRNVQHSLLELSPMPDLGWGWMFGEGRSPVQVMRNTLSLNRGDGTYAEIAQFSGVQASEWTWGVVFCDVDLDGYEDLLIANGHGRDLANSDALAEMDRRPKAVEPAARLKTLHLFPSLALPHVAFRNRGDLTFDEVSHAWGFDVTGVANGMILADLDNDGDLDVVMNNLNGPPLLLRNDSVAPRVAVRLKGSGGNTQGVGAKIKVTGGPVAQSQEVISGGRYLSGDDPLRVFAAGAATNRLRIEVAWRSGKRSVIEGVEANRLYEVAESGANASAAPTAPATVSPIFSDASQLLGHTHFDASYEDFERQQLLSRRLSQLGPGVAWCDLDGDGWDDLVIAAGRGGSLSVLHNNGQGGFQPVTLPAFKAVAADDLTGIVGWSSEPGQSTLLVGQANYESAKLDSPAVMEHDMFFGNVESAAAVPGDASSVGPLAVADVAGDGNLELFVGGRVIGGKYPVAASSRIYRRAGNKWELDEAASAPLKGGGLVSGAVWADLDGDGKPELVLACEWGPVRIFRNQNGQLSPWDAPLVWAEEGPSRTSRFRLTSQLTGWWNSVTAGDFDGDGRLDLVLGNFGLNNKYREFLSDGLRVYHGDVDGNGIWDLIEAYANPQMKKVVPWRDWKTMRGAIPMLSERFKTYREYGEASVEEIVGAGFKQLAELRVDVLESVVLLNRGDKFEVRALPVEAQLSPAFGLCVGDYDGDGKEDLFVSQNFFGTDLETGRYDAGRGLWLQGDGRGDFRAVPGQESGVKVYGDQRGAALGDFDGDGRVDLVVSQNGAQTKLYRNTGGKPGLRVRLTGAGSNGSGFGAVARLGRDGQWGAAREVHGGSGYWSQDSAVQVMSLSGGVPAQIQVRWPGGKVTTNDVPANAQEIRVSADGIIEKVK